MSIEVEKKMPGVIFKHISAGRTPFFTWFISSALEKALQVIYRFVKDNLLVNAYASSKRSFLLNRLLKNEKSRYDLIVAHNLAALYPASRFARKTKTLFAFDVEDYHPGEMIHVDIKNEVRRREMLLASILPNANYVSYASPLIGDHTLQLLQQTIKRHFFIPNCFSQLEFHEPAVLPDEQPLKLVWFSQHISFGRGLEELIEATDAITDAIELHLIGQSNPDFVSGFIADKDYILLHPPMPQADLHKSLAFFDVGLSLDMSRVDLNRDIALTNKIYAYAQAGLYVLATNTKAHKWFIENYAWGGVLTGQTSSHIRNSIIALIKNKQYIREQALLRYYKSKNLSWENQSHQLLEVWKLAGNN